VERRECRRRGCAHHAILDLDVGGEVGKRVYLVLTAHAHGGPCDARGAAYARRGLLLAGGILDS
jgi:hypothetical protein